MKQQQELLPMDTGEYLKQQRGKRKLSLASVAKAINLEERVLADIEAGQKGDIALVYRNGYIRTYARYLNIPDDVIAGLLVQSDEQELPVRNIFAEAPKRDPIDKWLRATSYVLASLLIGTLAWQFSHEAVRLSQNGSRLPGDQETALVSDAGVSQSQAVRGPVNASIATLGALHGNRTEGLDPAEQAWAAVSRPELTDGESRLKLSVSADSWVEIIDADGQELEMDLLRGGNDKSYHGKPPFRILIGRASAVRLSMDGEELDLTAFAREDVAQFSWPQKIQVENTGPDSD
jgi:cytoskeleton protein RodZ